MSLRLIVTILFLFLSVSIVFAQQPGAINGKVFEKGTRKAISGANLFLEPLGEITLSDQSGSFQFSSLPPGQYQVVIAVVNYKKPDPISITVQEGTELSVAFYLEPESITMLEVIVETERKAVDPDRQTVQRKEVEKIPGTGGDAIVAIQNLPGMIPEGGYTGSFLARGSGPLDNAVLFDGVPVLQPLHFAGWLSTINTDLIQSIDSYPGGFPARYWNAMGAVLDITSREPQRDGIHSRLNTSAVFIDARIEGPIGDRSGFYLAARRGFMEYLPISEPGTTVIPVFNDYQAKLSHDLSDRHRLSFLAFGSYDRFTFKTDHEDPIDPITNHFGVRSQFHDQAIRLRSQITPQFYSVVTLFRDDVVQRFTLGEVSDLFIDIAIRQVRLTGDFTYESANHTVVTGIGTGKGRFNVKAKFIQQCGEGNPACSTTNAPRLSTDVRDTAYGNTFYMEDTLHFRKVDLTVGGRTDYFQPIGRAEVSPRLAALFHLTKAQRIKAAYGHYYQWPDRNGEFIEGIGTPGILSSRAIHHVIGYEHEFTPFVDLNLQGYYKTLDHLVVPSDEAGIVYDNDGVGYAKGAELLLRNRLTDRFFGWFSYGYSESRRKNHSQELEFISDYDRPHTMALIGSYQWTSRWSLGGRFQLVSGAPYTPIIGSRLDASNNLQPIYGAVNSKRFSPQHRIDVRLEYKKRHDRWTLTSYFEIWNVYNRLNPIGIEYNNDFSEKGLITLPGIIPFMGVTAEF